MSAETLEVSYGAVSHGLCLEQADCMEGRICYYSYSAARNYLSTKVVPVNQTEQIFGLWGLELDDLYGPFQPLMASKMAGSRPR